MTETRNASPDTLGVETLHDGGPMPEALDGVMVAVKVTANGGTWMWPAKANRLWNWPVIIAYRLAETEPSVTEGMKASSGRNETLTPPINDSGEGEPVAWRWEKTGTDTNGDPVVFIGRYGDYDGKVTLSRTDRSWSATVNRGYGKLGLPSESAGMAHVESTVAGLLTSRLTEARETLALYAAPSPKWKTDGEAERLALEDARALDLTAEEADDNNWQDWGATMRQAAMRIRRLAALSNPAQALPDGEVGQ